MQVFNHQDRVTKALQNDFKKAVQLFFQTLTN